MQVINIIIFIIILVYLLGCILVYGKIIGSEYEIEEDYIDLIPCEYFSGGDKSILILSAYSWTLFFAATIIYFKDKEKYFFKWSFKPLIEKWEKS